MNMLGPLGASPVNHVFAIHYLSYSWFPEHSSTHGRVRWSPTHRTVPSVQTGSDCISQRTKSEYSGHRYRGQARNGCHGAG